MFEKHSKRRNDLDFVTDENENEERCRDCVDSSSPISVTFLFCFKILQRPKGIDLCCYSGAIM